MRIVLPWEGSFLSLLIKKWRLSGSQLAKGSSRIKMSTSIAIKTARATRCFSPPDTFAYYTKPIIKDLNLTLPSGFSLFVGPTGCGKSTLLKLIAGLYPKYAGKILSGKIDPLELPRFRFDGYFSAN